MMPKKQARKKRPPLQLGDVVPIATRKGTAYAQYVNHHAQMGELVRVIEGVFSEPLTDLAPLAGRPTQFFAFVPLRFALRAGLLAVVGNFAIPPAACEFPVFRTGLPDAVTGRIESWWLWDGEKSWKVGGLSDAERNLPVEEIINEAELVARVEQGWHHRDAT